jgi:phage shock protein A
MDKNGQNRGGSVKDRVAIAGYKKMRIEAFHMLEQLIESNNNLSDVVKDKHNLLKQAATKIKERQQQIEELQSEISEKEYRLHSVIENNSELEEELKILRSKKAN